MKAILQAREEARAGIGLTETEHLLKSPKNAERLLTALARARQGEGAPQPVDELRREAGLDEGDQ